MIAPRYLAALAIGALLWAGLFLGFTWFIDPYGVSPLGKSINRVNRFKPKRVDIDRILKPYEVWRYQPKTVFLGSSRIHQALDAAVLDGTPLAPAYNASIPASTLSENAAHLEQFFELDPNLKVVFVELFFSNFIFPNNDAPRKTLRDFATNTLALHLSATAVNDAVSTLWINRRGTYEGPLVNARGRWLPPKAPYAKGSFEAYVDSIMKIHQQIPNLELQPTVFAALDRIVAICRTRGAQLHLLISPGHPYDDYRWLSLGYWPLLEAWYRKLAEYPGVISFAQYHAPLEEPIKERMEYWYDPIHFSPKMGGMMLRSFLGQRDLDIPENMLMPVNRVDVEGAIAARRKGLEVWIHKNPEFVADFDAAKLATRNDEASRRWVRENPELAAKQAAEEREQEIARRSAGVAESQASLSELERQLANRFPANRINAYRNITKELLAANAIPAGMIRMKKVENAWRGPFNVQIFPSDAWRAGVAATYNFVFEGVPRNDCSRLVAALSRRAESLLFQINLEPSGKIHEVFPIVGDDGCREGVNSIGYTVMAR